ncbi:MAG: YibE/F family protein [Chloroflexi bacterium]|nr:YibE/F family protein [Chloroflexota bacterium]
MRRHRRVPRGPSLPPTSLDHRVLRHPASRRLDYPPDVERRPPGSADPYEPGEPLESGFGEGPDEDADGFEADFAAGTRPGRHLLRALFAVALIVGLFLMPDLSTQPDRSGLSAYRGQIVELDATPRPVGEGAQPNVRVRMSEGPQAGQVIDAHLEGPGGTLDVSGYKAGDEVVVTISRTAEGQEYVAVSDRWRLPQLAGLAALFAITVVLIGGWRGLRALIALGLTVAVVMRVLLPLLIEGVSPIPLAVAAATGVTITTIVLTEGWSRASVAAILGTATALALTGLLGALVTQVAGFTGAAASDLLFLQAASGGGLDLRGILLAAFILGSIGILDDVTVTQAAFIDEVGDRAGLRGRELFDGALDIGRSHIAATINTLFLAYVGATLPLLVILIVSQQPAALLINGEVIAIEIVRTLVGSIGIVAAVPITSAIATVLVGAADRDRRQDGGTFDGRDGSRRIRATDPLPALVGGLALVGVTTAVVAAVLGPLGPTAAQPSGPSGSIAPSPLASLTAGTPAPTGSASPSPRPSDDVVPLAVEGEPVDVLDADGRLGRVTLVDWETETVAGRVILHAQVAYESDRPWAIGPASWTVLAATGEETSAVSGSRSPSLEARQLPPNSAFEGWIEAPMPIARVDVFLVYRAPDGTAVFAVPLQ